MNDNDVEKAMADVERVRQTRAFVSGVQQSKASVERELLTLAADRYDEADTGLRAGDVLVWPSGERVVESCRPYVDGSRLTYTGNRKWLVSSASPSSI